MYTSANLSLYHQPGAIIAEDALHSTVNQQRAAEKAFLYGSWRWNADSDMIYWSDGMFEILGLSPADYPGNTVPFDLFGQYVSEDETREVSEINFEAAIAQKKDFFQMREWVRTTHNTLKYIILQGSFEYDKLGRLRHATGFCRDITEQYLLK